MAPAGIPALEPAGQPADHQQRSDDRGHRPHHGQLSAMVGAHMSKTQAATPKNVMYPKITMSGMKGTFHHQYSQ